MIIDQLISYKYDIMFQLLPKSVNPSYVEFTFLRDPHHWEFSKAKLEGKTFLSEL